MEAETSELGEDAVESVENSLELPQHKTPEIQPMKTLLSDAGVYSYAALCALALHDLYNNTWDLEFGQQCMKQLLAHLGLPQQVQGVMMALLEGQAGQETGTYVVLLKDEPLLDGKFILIVEDLVLFAVRGGKYDARMRVLIRHMAYILRVDIDLVELYEESVVEYLTEEQKEQTDEEKKEAARRQRNKKIKRYALIGLATLGGGAVLGLTGGLAAPLIGAGVGTFLGGASAAAIGSAAGVAIIGSLFGVAGAGLTGYKMKKRVGEVEEFAFEYLTEGSQLHVAIAVSGWLSDENPDNFRQPWRTLLISREQYFLRYESEYLYQLGQAMDYLLSFAVSMAAQEALKYTILSGIITAIAWPASLVTLASVIDNPWGVCCRRSAEVGKHLAEVLLARHHGQRPVTLIGFSLGARVIYYCLRELSQRKNCEGIVQDAILLGTPVTGRGKDWEPLAHVVCGKIVNGYCRTDWLLKFLYRTSAISYNIAGLQPIKWDDRRMINVDLSDIVTGHVDYSKKMETILKVIGVRTRDEVPDLDSHVRKSLSDFPSTGLSTKNGHIGALLRSSKSDSVLTRTMLPEDEDRPQPLLKSRQNSHSEESIAAITEKIDRMTYSSSSFGSTPSSPKHNKRAFFDTAEEIEGDKYA